MDANVIRDRLFERKLALQHAIEHRRRSRDPGEFTLGGRSYRYVVHRYNVTWLNERAVEVALGHEHLDRHAGGRVLELGNVMSHYGRSGHEVVDKYEIAPGVRNVDIVSWKPSVPYDAILTLSTLEHVGQDEEPQEPEKALRAVAHLVSLLRPGGALLATFPIGHNPALDAAVREDALPFAEIAFMRRVSEDNSWREVTRDELVTAAYGRPYPRANGLVVARHQA